MYKRACMLEYKPINNGTCAHKPDCESTLNMWLVFALLVACILQVHSHASSDLENLLLQRAGLIDAKQEAYLQSNTTNFEENNEQRDLAAATLETTALAQVLDELSLVTRYAGTGYNLVRGNPEGDFNVGGVDPGIRTTWEVFAHTYTTGKEAFYRGRTMQVPDQVTFLMSESCASSHTVKAYSGRKSYMKELQTSVSVSGKLYCNFCMHVK